MARTGNNDHADWNNEPPKDDFPYDKPDYGVSARIRVWQIIFWLGIGALFTVVCAAGWYWKHGGW